MRVHELKELDQAHVLEGRPVMRVLVVGGGRGGRAMIEALQACEPVRIDAVVDIRPDAPAFEAARAAGIPCGTEVDAWLERFDGDIIVDVTGDLAMARRLRERQNKRQEGRGQEVISGRSARLCFDMVRQFIRGRSVISAQNMQLAILDQMLEITEGLHRRPDLADLLRVSFRSLLRHAPEDAWGAAWMMDASTREPNLLESHQMPDSPDEASRVLRQCRGAHAGQRLMETPADETRTRMTALLWRRSALAGWILFELPADEAAPMRAALELAATHLRVAAHILDEYETLHRAATLDPLTGVFNRRALEHRLRAEADRFRRQAQADAQGFLACIFVDMDDFKQINDNFGHQAGDKAIRHVARALENSVRSYDTVARYGGDEFVVLLPAHTATDVHHLRGIAERILQRIGNDSVPGHPGLKLSASLGLAVQAASRANADTLIRLADEAAYEAKQCGKCGIRYRMDFAID